MQHLNKQLAKYRDRLCKEIRLIPVEAKQLTSFVATDIRFLPPETKDEMKEVSLVPVSKRYEELVAFQLWTELASSVRGRPEISRASVIVQSYICFLYLKDACFEVVEKYAKPNSVLARCVKFLLSGKVRKFRNAFAHAN